MQFYKPSPPRHSRPTSSLSLTEKLVIFGAIILLLFGVVGYFMQKQSAANQGAKPGGTYVEGVIADSPTKIERIVTRLTNIGLTYRESDDTIKPALAESWEATNDNKTYKFTLKDDYEAEGLLATIQSSKTSWSDIKITAPDAKTLEFNLNEPLNSFLSTTTVPLFPYGPYEVVKRDKKEITFRPNKLFPLPQPYIQKFEIRSYDSLDQLVKAAKNSEIDGTADFSEAANKTYTEYTVDLPRYHILFFNTTRPAFKKAEDRARVINEADGSPVNYTLLTNQSPVSSDLADSLTRSLALKNITLAVQKKNSVALQKEELAKRDFDLLLYGIDYGTFRDYYPFWHSSQVSAPGLNISGLKDKELDKLLESARKEQDPTNHDKLNTQIEEYLTSKSLQKVLNQEQLRFWISKSIKDVKYGTIDEGSDRFQLVWQWNRQ